METNMDNKPNTKPVKKGEIITLKAEYEGEKGDAITKINGFVIIIKKAKEGHTYECKINEVGATYAFANIIREIIPRTASQIMKNIDDKEE